MKLAAGIASIGVLVFLVVLMQGLGVQSAEARECAMTFCGHSCSISCAGQDCTCSGTCAGGCTCTCSGGGGGSPKKARGAPDLEPQFETPANMTERFRFQTSTLTPFSVLVAHIEHTLGWHVIDSDVVKKDPFIAAGSWEGAWPEVLQTIGRTLGIKVEVNESDRSMTFVYAK